MSNDGDSVCGRSLKLSLTAFVRISKCAVGLALLCLCCIALVPYGILPAAAAVVCIYTWRVILVAALLWGALFFFRKVSIICPQCGEEGELRPPRGFVCPQCGVVPVTGIIFTRYGRACGRSKKGLRDNADNEK